MQIPRLGANHAADSTQFCVWAPYADRAEVHLLRQEQYVPLTCADTGYFYTAIPGVKPGDKYTYRLDGDKERPDPASRSQPEGVHGPSQVVDQDFDWTDAGWTPPSRRNQVMYELHVGTFSPEGTFEGAIPYIPYLKDLGVTTLQLMPVVQFPGPRNWGYDGVQLYAPHHDYGGVAGLKTLINACHNNGLAVMLDAVYNHLGPEGNYLWDYGPYFTDRYHSPWGESVNFDGPQSDHVRRFFIDNAIYWLETYHVDGLRLDATHALLDFSAVPFLQELATHVHDWAARQNRRVLLIAENDRSDRRLTLSREANGLGLDGQWLDDLHHVLHVALTREKDGYYADYQPFELIPKVLRESFAYTGQYSPARQRRHGTSARDIPADRFVVATQTHDQVGNRMLGERLTQLTDFDGLKLAAGLLACSPYIPMLFMGEEYGETAPFQYFVSHGDPGLIEAVRQGRAEEFAAFEWQGTPPDPQAIETFERCKLDHHLREMGQHALLLSIYQDLLTLRKAYPALTNPDREAMRIYADNDARILCLERWNGLQAVRIFMNFDLDQPQRLTVPGDEVQWRQLRYSHAPQWCLQATETALSVPKMLSPAANHMITLPPKGFVIYKRTIGDRQR
ncbi:MAG: malto-oligosyltrehalose trehalohydrolase [Chloroflexi bacterium]|nr:malto-oligosyltrehalose trehalohydrolase [Chloroflexota bacterium]